MCATPGGEVIQFSVANKPEVAEDARLWILHPDNWAECYDIALQYYPCNN